MLKSLVERSAPEWNKSIANHIFAEAWYNRLDPFFWAMVFYVIAALLWLVAKYRYVLPVAWAATIGGLLFHIVGFVLRTNNDERFFINVDTDSLDELNRSMPNAGRTWIGELLKQGNKVRVTTIVCGSGSLEFADSVRLPD